MIMQTSVFRDVGMKRQINQDNVLSLQSDTKSLFIVADGMGGHFAGEKASRAICDCYQSWWNSTFRLDMTIDRYAEELVRILTECNWNIKSMTPQGTISGSTIVLLWIFHDRYIVLNVGDSRCYLLTDRMLAGTKVTQLTRDDIVLPGPSVRRENIGKLTRAVGAMDNCQCSVITGSFEIPAMFVLCSDGVYKYCSKAALRKLLVSAFEGESLRNVTARLSQSVIEGGAGDNYSFIIARTPRPGRR